MLSLARYANFVYLRCRRSLAYLHLLAVSPSYERRYWWEWCVCYLASVNWYGRPVASLTVGLNSVPITESFSVISRESSKGNVFGYYRNLGSLRAGTRHHSDRRDHCSSSQAVFSIIFWRNCRGLRIYTASSSSYLHASRQLASHLDWREPIERLEGRSSHKGEFLRDVSSPLSGNRGYDSNRRRFLSLCECAVSSSLGCAHSCPRVFCCVARSSCFYRLRAFMLYLVLCGFHVVMSCFHVVIVLHMAGELFAGHVLVFLFCVSTWLLS